MIEAISRGCKATLADGTVRYTVEIGPSHAAEAAQLFGMPGVPVVLARLTQEAAQASAQAETIAEDSSVVDKPKGGPLAKLAGMWCSEPTFWEWLKVEHGATVSESEVAGSCIRMICEIESRAELDHNGHAARIFNEKIRTPYMEYLRK